LEHDLLGLGFGGGLVIGQGLEPGFQVGGLGHGLIEVGAGAAFELAFELADLVAGFLLFGAEGVGLGLEFAAALVGGSPLVNQLGEADALDLCGVFDRVGVVAQELGVEHGGVV
jgi:hypothetical protein